MRRALFLACWLLAVATRAPAAPAPRPYTGCGVLALRPELSGEAATVVLYGEPGVERLGEAPLSSLPRLAGKGPEPLVAVAARRGGWSRLAVDDAGREGWVEPSRVSEYLPWEEFLPGKRVKALPGLKKVLYAVRSEPREAGRDEGHLAPGRAVRIVRTEGDWVLLESPPGWLRWRDSDGRFTLSLQEP